MDNSHAFERRAAVPPAAGDSSHTLHARTQAQAERIAPLGLLQGASIKVDRGCCCGALVELTTTPFRDGSTWHLCIECHETEPSLAYWLTCGSVVCFALVGRA